MHETVLEYFLRLSALCMVLDFLCFLEFSCGNYNLLETSTIQNHSKPWTRWWWMGSSVTKTRIAQLLEAFKDVGFCGMEIIPIYGETGNEDNFIIP